MRSDRGVSPRRRRRNKGGQLQATCTTAPPALPRRGHFLIAALSGGQMPANVDHGGVRSYRQSSTAGLRPSPSSRVFSPGLCLRLMSASRATN
jgi:hypothetical protein